jgi:hypothetical protein
VMNPLTAISDRMAREAAREVTRRRFLRTAGGAAVGMSVGVALAGIPNRASATGSLGWPCGPSPICPSAACGSNGQCAGTARRRNYATYNCSSPTAANCWVEDYSWCGPFFKWKCCDCCAYSGGGPTCAVCTDNKKACICRSRCDIAGGCTGLPTYQMPCQ